ncbi:hypothetical protein P5V15_014595 [Pogonomyrmex californicus]
MRMNPVCLSALIFCMILVLVAANLDLGPIITIAQCRSTCLRHHMDKDVCVNNESDIQSDCDEDQGCETAYKFYITRENNTEEEKYDPTKLPAPEENGIIDMNEYDIAVLMQKNLQGIWEKKHYYYVKQQFEMIPGGWVIIVADDGVVKQYSWEKWRPKLESLKTGGPLYQAHITWQDWRTQLKNQCEKVTSNYFKTVLKRRMTKEKQSKPSFVVTWQQETGDGIMGNQVTDSESAQISLPRGKYLVRIATNNGPGSYPIVIDTKIYESPKKSNDKQSYVQNCSQDFIVFNKVDVNVIIISFSITTILGYCFLGFKYGKYRRMKKKQIKRLDECLTGIEKLTKAQNYTELQIKEVKLDMPFLCPNCNHSLTNLKSKLFDTSIDEDVKETDANANTQNTNANMI